MYFAIKRQGRQKSLSFCCNYKTKVFIKINLRITILIVHILKLMKKVKLKNKRIDALQKSPSLYIFMIMLWIGLTAVFWWVLSKAFTVNIFTNQDVSTTQKVISYTLIVLNGIFISYFWLNGVKDLVYVTWYFINKKRLLKRYEEILHTDVKNVNDKVLFIYCTCNDFDGSSLEQCMHQNK